MNLIHKNFQRFPMLSQRFTVDELSTKGVYKTSGILTDLQSIKYIGNKGDLSPLGASELQRINTIIPLNVLSNTLGKSELYWNNF